MTKLILVLGVLGASLSAIFVRSAEAPALVLVFFRMLFSTIALLPAALLKGRQEFSEMNRRELLLSLLSGVFLGLHFTFYFTSLRFTTIAASVVLVDTEVFFVAILGFLVWKRKLPQGGLIGIGLTFFGSILIAGTDLLGPRGSLWGDLLALVGAACVGGYTLLGTEVRKTRSTLIYTTVVYSAGTLVVGLMLLLSKTPVVGYLPRDYLAGAGLALFCTLLGHSVFSWGLKYESPAFVSTVKLLEPVFSTLMGMALFQEFPSWLTVLGGLVVIFGVAWYARAEGRASMTAGLKR